MKVVDVLLQGPAAVRRKTRIIWNDALHTFQRGSIRNGEFMKVGLELTVTVKPQAPYNPQNRCRICVEALG